MNLENDSNFFYEEYRGHIIASTKNNVPENSNSSNLIVYYNSDSPEYAFIVGSDKNNELGSKESFKQMVNEARSYIDLCCCQDLNRGIEKPGTALPIVDIEGTDFFVDVTRFQLIEMFDSNNVIPFDKMMDYGDRYQFDYNTTLKNVPDYPNKRDKEIEIPEFVILDPVGMAKKYKISEEEVKSKTDFDFMVDQKEYDLRVSQGQLPTIDIAGHLFYVDMRMNKLRPKDDFLSKGISFSEIDDHFSEEQKAYLIPYDPKKHEFRALDYENITTIPTDLIAVAFPFQKILDPVGWNRQNGWYIKDDLKHIGVKGQFTAKEIDWNHTYIVDIIKDNLERNETISKKELKIEPTKGKGRKM
ncbi:MAG: hypothetical protein EOO20_04640 [Chryseobacterium sp.]|nr:MAG: hypothetical protein EOO20_04640 [Chryseobacterium sp.]